MLSRLFRRAKLKIIYNSMLACFVKLFINLTFIYI